MTLKNVCMLLEYILTIHGEQEKYMCTSRQENEQKVPPSVHTSTTSTYLTLDHNVSSIYMHYSGLDIGGDMRYTTQITIHMFETIFLRISLTALIELLAVTEPSSV